MLGDRSYLILAILTVVAIAAVPLGLWRNRRSVDWDVLLLLSIALCGIWFAAIVRGTTTSLIARVFIPGARYAYPAIIPTLTVLNFGWLEVLRHAGSRLHLSVRMQHMVYCLLFIVLDIVALVSILRHYG